MERMDEDIRDNGLDLKPGVLELFRYLKDNGKKIALATFYNHVSEVHFHPLQ